MEQMQAIGFRRYGPPEVLESIRVARPVPAAGEVVVRVVAAGVNPADSSIRQGMFRLFMPFRKRPIIPGSDIAGVVAAVGPDVHEITPGMAVYGMLPTLSGGGYAEFVTAKAADLAAAPTSLPLWEAAAAPLAALTALQALRDQAGLQAGQMILINGASGGVGSFAVQIARILGAHVTAACSTRNFDLVRGLGADAVLDYTAVDVTAGPPRFDVIFDAAYIHQFRRWRSALNPDGVLVGVNPAYTFAPLQWFTTLGDSRRLRGVAVQPSRADLQTIAAWIDAGQLRPLIDRTYALSAAREAQRYSETRRARGKVVLRVSED